jgi:hypothetical protein
MTRSSWSPRFVFVIQRGKSLLIVAYGGAGDQIQHARYFRALRELGCTRVTVETSAGLVDFFAHNVPGIEFVQSGTDWCARNGEAFDYWATFVTLAAAFDFAPAPIGASTGSNYLQCPTAYRQNWMDWAASRCAAGVRKIGMNWRGVAASDAYYFRASRAHDFSRLAQMAGVQGFCVNRDIDGEAHRDSGGIIIRRSGVRIPDSPSCIMVSEQPEALFSFPQSGGCFSAKQQGRAPFHPDRTTARLLHTREVRARAPRVQGTLSPKGVRPPAAQ